MQAEAKMSEGDDVARIESLLDALADTRRELAALQAREAALLATAVQLACEQRDRESTSGSADIPLRSMAAQIAACLRVSDRTVQQRLDAASILVTRFPATFAALSAGEIDRAHAHVIVDAGLAIDDDTSCAEYEDAALAVARRETPGRLRPTARTLAHRAHPIPLRDRHRTAAARRGVWVRDGDDGMADLIATLPAALAHGIHDRLTQLARLTLQGPTRSDTDTDTGTGTGTGDAPTDRASTTDPLSTAQPPPDQAVGPDHRCLSEVRADVFADLLLTGHATATVSAASLSVAHAIVAQVQIAVPALSLLGSDAAPAELIGHGPIDPDTARTLTAHAPGWDRVLTHPLTDAVIATDRYRPTEHQRRTLRIRDQHCRFPGCRQPTARCDIDHTVAHQHDGPTHLENLAHLCRRHHTLKHHSAWRVRQLPDGTLEWTSPTGRRYPDAPARTLTFTTTGPPNDPAPTGDTRAPAGVPASAADAPPF